MTEHARSTEFAPPSEASQALCELLCSQIASAHDGNLSQVEHLCAQAEGVVTQIKGSSAGPFVTEAQKARLERLYGDLVLTLQAERADVGARLKRLRRVKKAVGAYGGKAIS